MPTVKQFLDYLRGWLGYCGKKSAEQLEDFSANRSGKYTIFSKYFDDLRAATGGPLNTNKQNSDWCAILLLYAAIACCGGDIFKGFELLCQTWGTKVDNCAAGVAFMWDWFGYYSGRRDNNPQIGDVAFINDEKGKLAHVAAVESFDHETITTIDGNWGDMCQRVTRPRSEFRGFGHPKFAEPVEVEEPEKAEEPENVETAYVAPVDSAAGESAEPTYHKKPTLEEIFEDEDMLRHARAIEEILPFGYTITDLEEREIDSVFYMIRGIVAAEFAVANIIADFDEKSIIDGIKKEIIEESAAQIIAEMESDVKLLIIAYLDEAENE